MIELKLFGDKRGYFFEGYNEKRYAELGIKDSFKQDNYSLSAKGVLRGMHFQNPGAQGKLVGVLRGAVFDVMVDLRRSSPFFGQWMSVEISDENHRQVYIPPGFAHGFVSLMDDTLFYYKCTDFYNPSSEKSLLWNDPEVGIKWPVSDPLVSPKDVAGVRLRDFSADALFP